MVSHSHSLSVCMQDKDYFGWGTSFGRFHDETYFLCGRGKGLFVSLEKLFPYHPPDTSPSPLSQPRELTHKPHFTTVPTALEVRSPVQLVQDPSRHGVIQWLGNLPKRQELIAGVELVCLSNATILYGRITKSELD